MSYCRTGVDSDVYIFHSVYGELECCGCGIMPKHMSMYEIENNSNIFSIRNNLPGWLIKIRAGLIKKKKNKKVAFFISNNFTTKSRLDMINHINDHVRKGHKIPGMVFRRLRNEFVTIGDNV